MASREQGLIYIMKIKKYSTPEEVRRDLSTIMKRLDVLDDQVDHFQEALAFAQQRINAAKSITLRDKSKDLLEGMDKVKNIPQRALKDTEISKTFSQLEELVEQKAAITNMIVQLEQNFEESKTIDRMILDAKKTRDKVDKALKKAKKVSDKIAARHLPKQFTTQTKKVFKQLETKLKDRFEDSNMRYIVARVGVSLQYVCYMHFTELKDDESFVYSDFYVVVVQNLDKDDNSYHVRTLTDFRLPGRLSFSKHSRVDKIQHIGALVSDRLASEKFVAKVAPKQLPLTPDQIKFTHKKLDKTVVRDNRIYVTLKGRTSKATAEQVRMDLQAQLVNIVKARFPRNRDIIRGKTYQDKGSKSWRIQFVFTISQNYRGVVLDPGLRSKLKDLLNLDEKQLNKLQEALDQIGDT